MFKKISMVSICLLTLCTVRAEQPVAVPSEPVGSVESEVLTLAPKPRAKRVSLATLRNELIDVCEAFAHQLIAEVAQVSALFERYGRRKKQNEDMRTCFLAASHARCAALNVLMEFWGTTGLGTEEVGAAGCSAENALVCAHARWMQALAKVQEVLLTEVKLLLEQDAQGHFYGATKDELRKAKGSIESFMKDSIDCLANLKVELSECNARGNRSKNNHCKEEQRGII